MAYGSIVTPGGTLAATGLATGQMWLMAASVAVVLLGVVAVRLRFRQGKGAVER